MFSRLTFGFLSDEGHPTVSSGIRLLWRQPFNSNVVAVETAPSSTGGEGQWTLCFLMLCP
jgi:hypothetical protein